MERVPIEHLFQRARYPRLWDGGLLQYVRDCKILKSYCDSRCVKCAEEQESCMGNGIRLSISKAGEDLATS
jgi:hypothetical protein